MLEPWGAGFKPCGWVPLFFHPSPSPRSGSNLYTLFCRFNVWHCPTSLKYRSYRNYDSTRMCKNQVFLQKKLDFMRILSVFSALQQHLVYWFFHLSICCNRKITEISPPHKFYMFTVILSSNSPTFSWNTRFAFLSIGVGSRLISTRLSPPK